MQQLHYKHILQRENYNIAQICRLAMVLLRRYMYVRVYSLLGRLRIPSQNMEKN